jgi:D-3-phosphoglycerate dehydrogenase
MLRMMDELVGLFSARGVGVHCPEVVQTLPESELIALVPRFDGWIIGDDPATAAVLKAGRAGRLKAAVKWGIGVDNVDLGAARALDLPLSNTPQMFGSEVADVAMGYLIGLARETFFIDREVRRGCWPKPRGVSLAGKVLGLVGFGDIGRKLARRALASGMSVCAYDPAFTPDPAVPEVMGADWPAGIEGSDFLVFACALTADNRQMLNAEVLARVKPGVRIVNVARGGLIDERALEQALAEGRVHSVALDVFEAEPLPPSSPLRGLDRCIFGSHNASNTAEAVRRTSERAIGILFGYLGLGDG